MEKCQIFNKIDKTFTTEKFTNGFCSFPLKPERATNFSITLSGQNRNKDVTFEYKSPRTDLISIFCNKQFNNINEYFFGASEQEFGVKQTLSL